MRRASAARTAMTTGRLRIGLLNGGHAEFVEGFGEQGGDLRGIAALDFVAMNHVDGLAVLKQGDGGRRRRIILEQRADVGNGGFVTAGEYGSRFRGTDGVLERESNGRAGASRGASANRVDHHHDGAGSGEQAVDIGWRACFFHAEAGELGSHGSNKMFWVCHDSF